MSAVADDNFLLCSLVSVFQKLLDKCDDGNWKIDNKLS
jgi:hypothetical protein